MKFSTSLVKFGSVGDLALEVRKALTAIAAGWNVEHHPDGTHKASVTGVRVHAPTHTVGGSDPVTVTTLAGYPGGSTTFLRADHTFATPTGTVPAAHAATHGDGGSDELALDGSQITTGTVPDARLSGNVALENAANTFSQPQEFSDQLTIRHTAPAFNLIETDGPPDAKNWQVIVNAQVFQLVAHSDAWSPVATPLIGERDGKLRAGGPVYERGRSVPMGEWIDMPFSAANFTTPTGGATWVVTAANYAYMLVGKSVSVSLHISGTATVTGAPVRFKVTLPFTPNRSTGVPFTYLVGATAGTGLCGVDAGVGTLDLLRDPIGTTFPAGTMYLYLQVLYSIA